MKKFVCAVILVMVIPAVSALSVDFGYPLGGEPWYFLQANFPDVSTLGPGTWTVSRVAINGARARDFRVFQNGKESPAPAVDGRAPFDLKIRWSWEAKKTYEIQAELENSKTGKTARLAQKGQAPSGRGYWDPSWKNYLSLVLSEDNGYERTGCPVHATFGVLSHYLKSADEIRLVKAERQGSGVVYRGIPHQVYDVRTWNDPKILALVDKDEKTGRTTPRTHPTTSFSLAFLADLKPNEKATYLVFFNNPAAKKAASNSSLKVTGQGLGKTIENAFYKVVLHPKSGTIYEVTEKSSKTKLEHKLETNGSVHWNPDVYSPPHAWYHCSDWDNPRSSEDIGPVFYSLRREAPLPMPKGVQVSITYYFYDRSPVILMESTMEIENDIFVKSLRNAEIVFNKEVFNRATFRLVDGTLQTLDFAASKMHPDHAAVLRPDTPWVAFTSDAKNVGFASLFLDLTLPNRHGGPASQQQPYIYIQHGPWFYMSRGFVYSFGSNNQTRMLPVRAGSLYYDRNAWIPFSFTKEAGFAGRLDAAYKMLKYPLGMTEDMETFTESPDGWIVPDLTEPFEEGVKKAIGGPIKK
jgi:hypothetical protein